MKMSENGDWRSTKPARIVALKDKDSFCEYVAEKFLNLVLEVKKRGENFRIVMSGGKTPVDINRMIAEFARDIGINWKRVEIFFSDERCVEPDHPDSNYRMVRKTLIEPLNIPGTNVFRIRGEIGPEKAAVEYEKQIACVFGGGVRPMFDLTLLGMGADGHTASLFPGSPVLNEKKLSVAPVGKGPEGHERVTLTYPALNSSRRIWFLISGEEKSGAFKKLLEGPFDPVRCPAQGVCPAEGELVYILGQGLSYGKA